MIYFLFRLLPVNLIAGAILLVGGLHFAGVDVLGIALDHLGLTEWSWSMIVPW